MTFQDFEQLENPMNGTSLDSPAALAELFRSLNGREPFLFELRGDSGFRLIVGFAEELGCVQYSPSDGSPPYLMAVAGETADGGRFLEFLAGGTLTPVSLRYCLPIDQVEKIAAYFLASGGKSAAVHWEEI